MAGSNDSKMTRQLKIYLNILTTTFHGPEELMEQFGISRRMLQRDLKDLRDAGQTVPAIVHSFAAVPDKIMYCFLTYAFTSRHKMMTLRKHLNILYRQNASWCCRILAF